MIRMLCVLRCRKNVVLCIFWLSCLRMLSLLIRKLLRRRLKKCLLRCVRIWWVLLSWLRSIWVIWVWLYRVVNWVFWVRVWLCCCLRMYCLFLSSWVILVMWFKVILVFILLSWKKWRVVVCSCWKLLSWSLSVNCECNLLIKSIWSWLMCFLILWKIS